MDAEKLLMTAADLLVERGKGYDLGKERSMARTVAMFNVATGRDLSEIDGWLFMQCLKIIRQQTAAGYHADSYADEIAYVALKAEAASNAGGVSE